MTRPALRIFISSPGDVGLERDLCSRAIERLQGEFLAWFDLQEVRWEKLPMLATGTFQLQIVPPSQTDIVVAILWSRLGSPLPEDFRRPDGSRYIGGTEWEIEDARRGAEERGGPNLLIYRRTEEPKTSVRDKQEFLKRQEQFEAVEEFVKRQFFNEDGTNKSAFKTYETPEKFEHLVENDLRSLLRDRVPSVAGHSERMPAAHWTREPYRGLKPFEPEHAPIFFGRTRAISDVKDALLRRHEAGCAFLVIFGNSGCGKSSLLRAGILGTLTRPGVIEGVSLWRSCILRPSDSPSGLCRGLASALGCETALPALLSDSQSTDQLEAILAKEPQHAIPPIKMALKAIEDRERQAHTVIDGARTPRLLVVVDQLEEMFTLPGVSDSQRTDFVKALGALAQSGLVWVVAAMRDDFFHRCRDVEELPALKAEGGHYDLAFPSFDEIGQIIDYPTRAAGLQFETDLKTGQRLDAVIHEAAFRTRESLPLLSFTMAELYCDRTAENFLTFEAYQKLGGLEGAIACHAKKVLRGLDPDVRGTLPAIIRSLATLQKDEDGQRDVFVSRRASKKVIAATPQRAFLLEKLIEARLIVTDGTGREASVRVAHEALLSHWPEAEDILKRERDFIATRDRVALEAAQWDRKGRHRGFLLAHGKPLAEALQQLQARRGELDRLLSDYLDASSNRRTRMRLAALVLAALIAVCGYWAWDRFYVPHVADYANFVRRAGVPHGVGCLGRDEWMHRHLTWRFTELRGRVEKVEAINGYGSLTTFQDMETLLPKQGDNNRVCSFEYHWADDGRLFEEWALDRAGRLIRKFQFSSRTTGAYLDGDDLPLPQGGSGASHVKFVQPQPGEQSAAIQPKGDFEEVRYIDGEGAPQANAEGVFGYRRDFDKNGLEIANTILDKAGKPALHRDGYAKWTAKYENGNRTEVAYFDLNNAPAPFGGQRYAKWKAEYDPHGNCTEGMFFGRDGALVETNDGYAQFKAKYRRGKQTRMDYFSSTGEPVANEDGCFHWEAEYDGGNQKEIRYYDRGGHLTPVSGYAIVKYTYDGGNRTEEAYFGADQKAAPVHGVSVIKYQYDDHGNAIKTLYCNSDGKPVPWQNERVAGFKTKYTYGHRDGSKSEATMTYFDVKDQPAGRQRGNYGLTQVFDPRGNLTKVTFLGKDRKPFVTNEEGYATKETRFDDFGREIETKFLDERRLVVALNTGYARVERTYSPDGETENYFDAAGNPNRENGSTTVGQGPLNVGYVFRATHPLNALDSDTGYAKCITVRDASGKSYRKYYDRIGQQVTCRIVVFDVIPESPAFKAKIAKDDEIQVEGSDKTLSLWDLRSKWNGHSQDRPKTIHISHLGKVTDIPLSSGDLIGAILREEWSTAANRPTNKTMAQQPTSGRPSKK